LIERILKAYRDAQAPAGFEIWHPALHPDGLRVLPLAEGERDSVAGARRLQACALRSARPSRPSSKCCF